MPAAYFEFTLRSFGTTRELRGALIDGTGVTEAQLSLPGAEITLGQQLRQIRNGNRLFGPDWCLRAGSTLEASTHGALAVAAVSAPTVADTLDTLARFSPTRNPAMYLRVEGGPSEVRLLVEPDSRLWPEERQALVELFLLGCRRLIDVVLGSPPEGMRFTFDTPPPPHLDVYRDYFGASVLFGQPEIAIVLPAACARLASPFADETLHALGVRNLEMLMGHLRGERTLAAVVERMLTLSGPAGLPLEAVAERLCLSRRTLIRRLQEHGTSFRELRDAHRRCGAEQYLRSGFLTTEQVAFELGYEDASSFSRACRRWFGTSPGGLRGRQAVVVRELPPPADPRSAVTVGMRDSSEN
jgi:AraC-like DNA-binding protein